MPTPKKKNKVRKGGRVARRTYAMRRRRVPVCNAIKSIGREMRKAIADHVQTCPACQKRAHENMTNNMIEVAVFSCDE